MVERTYNRSSDLIVRVLTQTRIATHRTQSELADMLGVTRQAVSSWESSAGAVSAATLLRWHHALRARVNPDGDTTVVVDEQGRLADVRRGTHALVTAQPSAGSDARAVADALVATTGMPNTTRFLSTNPLDENSFLALPPSAIIVEVDQWRSVRDMTVLAQLASRARMREHFLCVTALDRHPLPGELTQNLGIRVDVAAGAARSEGFAIVDEEGRQARWYLAEA